LNQTKKLLKFFSVHVYIPVLKGKYASMEEIIKMLGNVDMTGVSADREGGLIRVNYLNKKNLKK